MTNTQPDELENCDDCDRPAYVWTDTPRTGPVRCDLCAMKRTIQAINSRKPPATVTTTNANRGRTHRMAPRIDDRDASDSAYGDGERVD